MPYMSKTHHKTTASQWLKLYSQITLIVRYYFFMFNQVKSESGVRIPYWNTWVQIVQSVNGFNLVDARLLQ